LQGWDGDEINMWTRKSVPKINDMLLFTSLMLLRDWRTGLMLFKGWLVTCFTVAVFGCVTGRAEAVEAAACCYSQV
jgi:hypothetical protein